MKNVIKIVAFASFTIFIVLGTTLNANAKTIFYNGSCHLKANKGDILVDFNQTGILSDRHPNSVKKNLSVPAGKYKVQLEAFDGYKGRSKTDPKGQAHEQYYVRFMSGNSEVARTGTTGDVPDRREQAYWSGTVNNSLNINKSISSIYIQHAIPYPNRYPNSVNAICMVLTPIVDGGCGSSNGKVFDSKPTSGLCSSGSVANFSGNGPWSWRCSGRNDGATVSCSANITTPVCGSAKGKTFSTKPTTNLCGKGSATEVKQDGNNNYVWTCVNGSKSVTCDASHYVASCGNGVVDTGEKCDDGNKVNGDGCSASCAIEAASIKIVKDDNDNNNDAQSVKENGKATFKITVTNIGQKNLKDVVITDPKESNCDRNTSQTKKLYSGDLFDAGETFSYICVDTKVTSGYTNIAKVNAKSADDKNAVSDSDSTVVTIETPEPVCGNGKLESNEKCDDGNKVNGDGCSASCTIEAKTAPIPEPEEEEDDDGAIGNFVWNDTNKNCVQDPGEGGISGVKIKLYNGNKVKTDRTNSRGRYKFKGLDKGTYKVIVAQETIPEGCYQVCDPDGTKMDGKTKVKIKGDEYYRKADFGYYCADAAPVVTRTSPQTGAGTTAGVVSSMLAALSAGLVYRRNTKK